MNWNDLVEAAYALKPTLRISQKSWGEGCITIGREGAALCLVLTDQAMQREADPVRKLGAYFRAMINRAKSGELHLHNSVFGIFKREEGRCRAIGSSLIRPRTGTSRPTHTSWPAGT